MYYTVTFLLVLQETMCHLEIYTKGITLDFMIPQHCCLLNQSEHIKHLCFFSFF